MRSILGKARRFFFKKFQMAAATRRYLATPAIAENVLPMKTNFLIIVPIDIGMLALQFQSLSKIDDAFDYLVLDTSRTDDQAAATREFCGVHGISYVRQPRNPGLDASLKHGFSLNWAFYNIVMRLKPEYFGFLESDVIVIDKGSFLKPWAGKPFWGVKAPSFKKGDVLWRLWPGFCFFRRDFYKDKPFNFLPIKYLDTAGGNFSFLKNEDTSHLIPFSAVEIHTCTGDENGAYQSLRNIIHLVGILSMSDDPVRREGIRKKREMAERIVFEGSKN